MTDTKATQGFQPSQPADGSYTQAELEAKLLKDVDTETAKAESNSGVPGSGFAVTGPNADVKPGVKSGTRNLVENQAG